MGRGLWLATLAIGCGVKDTTTVPPIPTDTTTDTTTDTGPPPPPPRPGPDMVLTAAANYTLTQELTVASVELRDRNDILVSWPLLTTDLLGAPILPTDFDEFQLYEIVTPVDEFANQVEKDDLGFDLLSKWTVGVSGVTSVHTNTLAFEATPFVPFNFFLEDDNKTWLAALASLDADGVMQPRAYKAFLPVAGGATGAPITDADFSLTWSATIGAPIETATGYGTSDEPYTIDWSDLGDDALGKPYDDGQGSEMFIGKVDGVTDEQLAAAITNLRPLATDWYTMDVLDEDHERLDLARNEEGAVFREFSAGEWIIGVRCPDCLAPFPLWLTRVHVVE
jgi:hypothetical protein